MRKTLIIPLLVMLLAVVSVAATWEYQETPNATYNYGYSSDYAEDGVWTWGEPIGMCTSEGNCTYVANYEIPAGATSASLLQISYAGGSLAPNPTITNLSIPAGCWNAGSPLKFAYLSNLAYGASVTPETKVITPIGEIQISQIKKGDLVLASINNQAIFEPVIGVLSSTGAKTIYTIYYSGGSVKATDEHRFILANGNIKQAKDLVTGDILAGISGNIQITQIQTECYYGATYDLVVAEGHNFYANGVLVHNLDAQHVAVTCDNGTGNTTMMDELVGTDAGIVEAAMWWDISTECTSDCGTEAYPFLITNCTELQDIENNLTAYYELANDINCSGITFDQIGGEVITDEYSWVQTVTAPFSGNFDGKGHIVSDLTITTTNSSGLFSSIDTTGRVANLNLVNVNITGKTSVGGITGVSYGIIDNCSVTGIVTATSAILSAVGGLVGENYYGLINNSHADVDVFGYYVVGGLVGDTWICNISNSYSTGTVTGTGYSGTSFIGGFAGYTSPDTIVSTSYSTSTANGEAYVGGFVGYHYLGAIIKDSYSTGSATGSNFIGGFDGYLRDATILNSYSNGSVSGTTNSGGFVGHVYSGSTTHNVSNSYWDNETSGWATSDGGEGKTTAQMKKQTTYSGWDFWNTWQKGPAQYPTLRVFGSTPYTLSWTEVNRYVPYSWSERFAVSDDGLTIMATVNNESGGKWYIALSKDGGFDWELKDVGFGVSDGWKSAMSDNGQVIFAVDYSSYEPPTNIHVSLDGGQTWTDREFNQTAYYGDVGISGDGTKLFIRVDEDATTDDFYVSTDYGQTWSVYSDNIELGYTLTSSYNGGILYNSDNNNGVIAASYDGGATWSVVLSDVWVQGTVMDTSSDGMHVCAPDTYYLGNRMFVSHDYGATWTNVTMTGVVNIQQCAISDDGNFIIMNGDNGGGNYSYYSTDGGLTYSLSGVPGPKYTLGMNKDASKIIMANQYSGNIWVTGEEVITPCGTEGSPCQITTCQELQDMNVDVTKYYELANNIDCSDTINWNDGTGFWPITQTWSGPYFTGGLEGKGYNITGLYMHRTDTTNGTGLSFLGGIDNGVNITNVHLVDVNITGYQNVGALAGLTQGNIINCSSSGYVSGEDTAIGGLIGYAEQGAIIQNSYSTATVTGNYDVGGLVGELFDTSVINNSYATGYVYAGAGNGGGLIGYMPEGIITSSYATGAVEVNGDFAGGLVGYVGDEPGPILIDNSYATGDVTGNTYVGGLIGECYDANITSSHAEGAVSGGTSVGGLIGRLDSASYAASTTTSDSYALGSVNGDSEVGGFIGTLRELNIIENSHANGSVTCTANYCGGLVGYSWTDFTISDSYATGAVNGWDSSGGFIGHFLNGTISNSHATGNVTGSGEVGGFMGAGDGGSVSNCYATGRVAAGSSIVGGFAGYMYQGNIDTSYALGDANGSAYIGGFIGDLWDGTIRESYSTGNVRGVANHVGGFIGFAEEDTYIYDSYSWGNVTGGTEARGGFAGRTYNNITNCYSIGSSPEAGFATVFYAGNAVNSYWDTEASGVATSEAGTGKTTAQMKKQTTYPTWDWTNTWQKASGAYPTLQAFGAFGSCAVCTETCSPCGGGCTATDLTAMYSGYDWGSDTGGYGDITGWDTSCITSVQTMFENSDFNQPIGGWDVSKVTDMTGMFSSATSFNQDLSGWNTSSVISFLGTFADTPFNQDISGWDTSSATDMSFMFYQSDFNQSIGSWDTSSVTTMNGMFGEAAAFNQDISGWDTSSVNDMAGMFYLATNFDQNIGAWDVSSLNDASFMFVESGLSTPNYDAILNGWAAQSVQTGVNLDANAQYTSSGKVGRDILTDTYSWTITDGGITTIIISPQTGDIVTSPISLDYVFESYGLPDQFLRYYYSYSLDGGMSFGDWTEVSNEGVNGNDMSSSSTCEEISFTAPVSGYIRDVIMYTQDASFGAPADGHYFVLMDLNTSTIIMNQSEWYGGAAVSNGWGNSEWHAYNPPMNILVEAGHTYSLYDPVVGSTAFAGQFNLWSGTYDWQEQQTGNGCSVRLQVFLDPQPVDVSFLTENTTMRLRMFYGTVDGSVNSSVYETGDFTLEVPPITYPTEPTSFYTADPGWGWMPGVYDKEVFWTASISDVSNISYECRMTGYQQFGCDNSSGWLNPANITYEFQYTNDSGATWQYSANPVYQNYGGYPEPAFPEWNITTIMMKPADFPEGTIKLRIRAYDGYAYSDWVEMEQNITNTYTYWECSLYNESSCVDGYYTCLQATDTLDGGGTINWEWNWEPYISELHNRTACSLCTPDWVCSEYDSCDATYKACLNVTDNNACGEEFTGNLGDYTGRCQTHIPWNQTHSWWNTSWTTRNAISFDSNMTEDFNMTLYMNSLRFACANSNLSDARIVSLSGEVGDMGVMLSDPENYPPEVAIGAYLASVPYNHTGLWGYVYCNNSAVTWQEGVNIPATDFGEKTENISVSWYVEDYFEPVVPCQGIIDADGYYAAHTLNLSRVLAFDNFNRSNSEVGSPICPSGQTWVETTLGVVNDTPTFSANGTILSVYHHTDYGNEDKVAYWEQENGIVKNYSDTTITVEFDAKADTGGAMVLEVGGNGGTKVVTDRILMINWYRGTLYMSGSAPTTVSFDNDVHHYKIQTNLTSQLTNIWRDEVLIADSLDAYTGYVGPAINAWDFQTYDDGWTSSNSYVDNFVVYEGTESPYTPNPITEVYAPTGHVLWTSTIDLTGYPNYLDYIIFGHNSLFVDTVSVPPLDAEARVDFYDTGYTALGQFVVNKDGVVCADCSNITISGGNVSLITQGFSNITLNMMPSYILSPNGGESYYLQNVVNITYTPSNGTGVFYDIDVSSNNGSSWTSLIQGYNKYGIDINATYCRPSGYPFGLTYADGKFWTIYSYNTIVNITIDSGQTYCPYTSNVTLSPTYQIFELASFTENGERKWLIPEGGALKVYNLSGQYERVFYSAHAVNDYFYGVECDDEYCYAIQQWYDNGYHSALYRLYLNGTLKDYVEPSPSGSGYHYGSALAIGGHGMLYVTDSANRFFVYDYNRQRIISNLSAVGSSSLDEYSLVVRDGTIYSMGSDSNAGKVNTYTLTEENRYAWNTTGFTNSTQYLARVRSGLDNETSDYDQSNATFSIVPFWCFQDSATTRNSCGAIGGGTYAVSSGWYGNTLLLNDSNWDSGTKRQTGDPYINITYQKPRGALNISQWQFANELNGIRNRTLPQACWAASPTNLTVQMVAGNANQRFNCWNGSEFLLVATGDNLNVERQINEDAMWWAKQEEFVCIPNWTCTGYSNNTCAANSKLACTGVTDQNACGENYTGNYLEFTEGASCVYTTFSGLTRWCYQESVNVSNQTGLDGDCGLNYTGTSNLEPYMLDGNWNTLERSIGGGNPLYTIVYKKPANAAVAVWRMVTGATGLTNITIPDGCFNYQSDRITLGFYQQAGGDSFSAMCLSGGWSYLSGGGWYFSGQMPIYEEGIAWGIMPKSEIIAPNGGENLTKGDVITINYTWAGIQSGVLYDLRYSINNGASWANIALNRSHPQYEALTGISPETGGSTLDYGDAPNLGWQFNTTQPFVLDYIYLQVHNSRSGTQTDWFTLREADGHCSGAILATSTSWTLSGLSGWYIPQWYNFTSGNALQGNHTYEICLNSTDTLNRQRLKFNAQTPPTWMPVIYNGNLTIKSAMVNMYGHNDTQYAWNTTGLTNSSQYLVGVQTHDDMFSAAWDNSNSTFRLDTYTTCIYNGAGNWSVSLADNCNITQNYNVQGAIVFSNNGTFRCNSQINATSIAGLGVNNIMYVDSNCYMRLRGG